MYGYIYKTTNLINGKIYIGKKKSKRFLPKYYGSGTKIKIDVLRYGEENFSVEIEKKCETKEELDLEEFRIIKKLNARDKNIGYNISRGMEGIKKMKKETNRDEVLEEDQTLGFVYTTNDYDKFDFMSTNRDLSETHLQKLKNQLSTIGQIMPILVTNDMKIIDGQHRYTVLRTLGKPVKYIISEHEGIEAVHSINTTAKNWNIIDYITQYSKEENENYKYLLETFSDIKKTPYRIPVLTLAKLMYGDYSVSSKQLSSEIIQDGSFVVVNKDAFDEILERYKIIVDGLRIESGFPREISGPLFSVMAYNNFNIETMLRNIKKETSRKLVSDNLSNVDGFGVFSMLTNIYNSNIIDDKNKIVTAREEHINHMGATVLREKPLKENLKKILTGSLELQ